MNLSLLIIILSVLAGVVGMGLGSIITALFGTRTERTIGIFLSFAGGVMLAIVLLELIPEAIEYSGVVTAVVGLIIGVFVVMGLNKLIDKITRARQAKKQHKNNELHDNYGEFFHADELLAKRGNMLRAGMVILFAIALHNIPEGLAMGAAGQYEIALGVTIGLLIALHNIPEGMAISAPLISGGLSKIKTILLTMAAGATTVIGTILGVLIGGISSFALALSLAIAGGAMLYVVFGEIFPQTIVTNKDRIPAISALVGIVVAIIFIALI
ncbi:MAG: ZIP family metal transporter [Coriobacteriia bacterium]|nr:ZIP family metal transporter [Coriobacteriia bacterium]